MVFPSAKQKHSVSLFSKNFFFTFVIFTTAQFFIWINHWTELMLVQIILDNVWPTVTLGTKVQNVLGQKANNSLPKMHLNRWKSAKWLDILIGKIHKYRKKEIAYGDWKTSFVLQMVQLIKYCFTYFISLYFILFFVFK